jgi:hypothetical protein
MDVAGLDAKKAAPRLVEFHENVEVPSVFHSLL